MLRTRSYFTMIFVKTDDNAILASVIQNRSCSESPILFWINEIICKHMSQAWKKPESFSAEKMDQKEARHRQIRRHYRTLNDELAANKHDVDGAKKLLARADGILEDVERPQEAIIDSRFYSKTVRIIKENAESRRGNKQIFNTELFAELFMAKYYKSKDNEVSTPDYWIDVCSRIEHCYRRAQPVLYLRGSIDCQEEKEIQKTSSKKKRRSLTNNEALKPTKYTVQTAANAKADGDKGPSVAELVEDVERCLRKACKKGRVELMAFVMDHDSFSETIRNIFLTSFLVKEKRASIYNKKKGSIPYIATRNPGDNEDSDEDQGENDGQLILTITKEQYDELKQLIPASSSPMIKFRSKKKNKSS